MPDVVHTVIIFERISLNMHTYLYLPSLLNVFELKRRRIAIHMAPEASR